MQALWLENNTLALKQDVPFPTVAENEALVRVRVAGICSTDLELVKGYYPYTGILGHEFVGEIIEAQDAPQRVGQRVVGEINVACGKCEFCRRGTPAHCEHRSVLGIKKRHGAFAEYLSLPLDNLIPVPPDLPDQVAVFTEPLAAALEIQEQITIRPTDKILIVGAGRLGQIIAQTLRLTGCQLQVVARYESQKDLLTSNKIDWRDEENVSTRGFDIVIKATGSGTGFSLAHRAVRPGGTILLKSTYKDQMMVNLSSLVVDEIHLLGSRCGPFRPALNLLSKELINPIPLIGARFPLTKGLQAFDRAARRGVLKVLLDLF